MPPTLNLQRFTLRDFVRSGVLLNDQGQPIQPTQLIDDMVEAYEGAYGTRVFVTCRRNGKSSGVALLAAYELLTRPDAFVVWLAGTADQAADILHQKIRGPLRRNPALRSLFHPREVLQMSRDRLINKDLGGVIQVMAPREISVPGRTITLLLVDEARSVDEEAYEVMRPAAVNGRIFVIGSPGGKGSWFHRAATDPEPTDFVRHYRTIVNPTLTKERVAAELARAKKRGEWGRLMFEREWLAEWRDLSEHPFLRSDDIDRGAVEKIAPWHPEHDTVYVAADLSLTKDLTSIAVVARRNERRQIAGSNLSESVDAYRVLRLDVFDPKNFGGTSLPLDQVERRLEEIYRRYRPRRMVADRYQAVALCQRLKSRGVHILDYQVSSTSNRENFEALSELLSQSKLTWQKSAPHAPRLADELRNLELSENKTGWTVIDRDKRLHRDLAWSLAAACREAVRFGNFHREPNFGKSARDLVAI